jgi:hypothetical protein
MVDGRGLCMYDGRALEFQAAILNPDASAQERNTAILEAAREAADRFRNARPARKLQVVNEKQEYAEFCADIPTGRIPLGYSLKDAKPVSLPLKQAFCLGVYFGNPAGRKKLLSNFAYAFSREGGTIVAVPKVSGSVLTGSESVLPNTGDVRVIEDPAHGSKEFTDILSQVIAERKALKDRYCAERGLDPSDMSSLAAASDSIRARVKPVFVIIENFAEFVQNAHEGFSKIWKVMMQVSKYYKICFLGCYEPDDTQKLFSNSIQSAFNPDGNVILFGGQMDKQNLVSVDFKSQIKTVLPKIGRGLMSYRGQNYPIAMPCGEEQQEAVSEEDASIF